MRLRFDKFSVFTAAALLVAGIFAFSGTSFAADQAYCAQYHALRFMRLKPTWRHLVVSRVSTIVGTLTTKGITTGA
jgi:hypothetical protein